MASRYYRTRPLKQAAENGFGASLLSIPWGKRLGLYIFLRLARCFGAFFRSLLTGEPDSKGSPAIHPYRLCAVRRVCPDAKSRV